MLINRFDKAYLVSADDDYIYVFHIDNLSYATSINEPLEFRGSSNGGYRRFARINRFIPITDKEIAELLVESRETVEEVGSENEQNYYTT